MKVLHLTLKKKWYDLIESGEKKEEYREIKPYWIKRLMMPECSKLTEINLLGYLSEQKHFRPFTHVRFYNGYMRGRREMTLELLGIKYGYPDNANWTSGPVGPAADWCFILKLGNKVYKP